VFDRASLEREPDPRARRLWIQAGLALLERGERESSDPGALAFERGLVLVHLASLDPDRRPWPATAAEAWRRATEAFDRAARLGHPLAAEAALAAQRHAAADGG
jgi:hypothetical protein